MISKVLFSLTLLLVLMVSTSWQANLIGKCNMHKQQLRACAKQHCGINRNSIKSITEAKPNEKICINTKCNDKLALYLNCRNVNRKVKSTGTKNVDQASSCSNCPEGNLCCDNQCYDPISYNCVDNFLCPKGLLSCNEHCYDQTEYRCEDGELIYIGTGEDDDDTDDTDEGLCGLCPEGNECCDDRVAGPQCYDPKKYVCIQGVELCSETYLQCGNKCYDPTKYQCINDALVLIDDDDDTDEGLCGLCPEGQDCCDDRVSGPQCYDPNRYVCIQGVQLCPETYLACGNKCYDPTRYQCINGALVLIGDDDDDDVDICGLCPDGQDCCLDTVIGPQCFDPDVNVCVQGNRLCPVSYLVCGNECYNPTQFQCINDQLVAIGDPSSFGTIVLGQTASILETGNTPRRYIVVDDEDNAPTGLQVDILAPSAATILISREENDPEGFDGLPEGFEELNGDFNGFIFDVSDPNVVVRGEYNLFTAELDDEIDTNNEVVALQFNENTEDSVVIASQSSNNVVRFTPIFDSQGRAIVYFAQIDRNEDFPITVGSQFVVPRSGSRTFLYEVEEDDTFGDWVLFRVENPSQELLVTLEQFDNNNPTATVIGVGDVNERQGLWYLRYRTEINPFEGVNTLSRTNDVPSVTTSTVTSDSTVTIRYNLLEGLDESSIQVYVFNSDTNTWDPKVAQIDPIENTIVIEDAIPEEQPSSVIVAVVGEPLEGEDINEDELANGVSKLFTNVYTVAITFVLLVSLIFAQ